MTESVESETPAPWPFNEYASQYQLAYESSIDAMRDQRDRLELVRSRAATILSTAALVTAFVGERIFDAGALSRLTTGWLLFTSQSALWLALVLFVAIAVSTLATWLPARGVFALSAPRIVYGYVELKGGMVWSMAELHRDASLWIASNVDENEPLVRWRQRLLAGACGALGFQLMLMLLVLWDMTP